MMPPRTSRSVRSLVFAMVTAWLVIIGVAPVRGQVNVTDETDSVAIRRGLVIDEIGKYGRRPVHQDAIESLLISGAWEAPAEGDTLESADGKMRAWRSIKADEKGWFSDSTKRGGYIYVQIDSDRDRIMLLHMMGNSMAYLNGVPRIGSRYQRVDVGNAWEPSFDYVRLPVMLKKGQNELLLQRAWRSGGRVKVELVKPSSDVLLNISDTTLPDLIVGEAAKTMGAVVVINATDVSQKQLGISVTWPDQHATFAQLPVIPPMSVRKVPFPIECGVVSRKGTGQLSLQLTVTRKTGGTSVILDRTVVKLGVQEPTETHRRTFISRSDGSVQYYAVNPATPLPGDASPPALVLSLHGAGVEAINQARAYASKSWCHIVAPTNRRPYGFDWEDWGRRDALEVLADAKAVLKHDPRRVYLTGHSMGGHGTWSVGATFPDKFAAIGPSAGWLSFWSYRGAKKAEHPSSVEKMLMRAELPGDTLMLAKNLVAEGVYILHGGADTNVPPSQSHTMVKQLEQFHKDFVYHEEPGQEHWWDLSDEPGADCVDWPPLFDFFARHALPKETEVRQVDFSTVNPGISSSCHWVTIEDQVQHLQLSSVSVRVDPGLRRFVGTTENVARLSFDVGVLPGTKAVHVQLDGQQVPGISCPDGGKRIWLERRGGQWRTVGKPTAEVKGPHRYGPFKEAFGQGMVFVFGTHGNDQENAWARNKVRFDAEQWWYQGNGAVEIIADTEFSPSRYPDRGVVIYGNSKTNSVWKQLLADSPIQVKPDGVTIGKRLVKGDDLACLFVRPRSDSDTACVAAVSGTGVRGMQLTNRLQYLFAGCNYPDCIVIGADMLTDGVSGVRVTGVFGGDWAVESGSFAWADAPSTESPDSTSDDKSQELPEYIGPDPRPFVMPRGYVCQKAQGKITVDGKLDEASWKKAPWTEYHVDIEGRMRPVEPKYKTRCKMLWDDDYFYVAAQLDEPHVWATITERNAVIFNDNDFEVFIDPDGDSHNYFEFEINAHNTVWNLFLDKPYKNGGTGVIREMPGQTSGVDVQGTLNDPRDTDQGWTLEIAFPWRAMAEHVVGSCPPRDGDQWRVGFSRVEWGHKVVDGKYVRVPSQEERTDAWHEDNWIWSPQGRINMHRPETWGYVQFSTQPVGSKVALRPDPTARLRYLLHKILYAQEAYLLRHGHYAETLDQLGLGTITAKRLDKKIVTLAMTRVGPNGWEAVGQVSLGEGETRTVVIRQDGKVTER